MNSFHSISRNTYRQLVLLYMWRIWIWYMYINTLLCFHFEIEYTRMLMRGQLYFTISWIKSSTQSTNLAKNTQKQCGKQDWEQDDGSRSKVLSVCARLRSKMNHPKSMGRKLRWQREAFWCSYHLPAIPIRIKTIHHEETPTLSSKALISETTDVNRFVWIRNEIVLMAFQFPRGGLAQNDIESKAKGTNIS